MDIKELYSKTVAYASVIEEINLKEKLTLKRSISLILILLKQCRANLHDKNLVDMATNIIKPILQKTTDKDNQLIVIEAVGLLSLLTPDLFDNYSKIFMTILKSYARRDIQEHDKNEFNLKMAITALKCSFDGLIFYGSNEQTQAL